MGFLQGKKALITGLANDMSIAYGISQACLEQGAELAFTYQIEKFRDKILGFCETWGIKNPILIPLDASTDESIANAKVELQKHWKSFDIIVHSMAFADKSMLNGDFLANLTRAGFTQAHEISSYSFAALAKVFGDMLNDRGALLTLTYLGAEKYVPNYNLMGLAKASLEASVRYLAMDFGKKNIRVNGISAGPIRTLAASGISDFRKMLDYAAVRSPMGRGVGIDEVGNAAAFLLSDLASAITGEIIHVDAGFASTAMAPAEVPSS